MELMEYKGYTATVEVDLDAGILYGYVLGLTGGIDFQTENIAELRREFETSVDDYLNWCREEEREPEKPFGGKIALRIEPKLHQEAALQAAREGVRLEDWLQNAVKEHLTAPSPIGAKRVARAVKSKRSLALA